MNAVFKNIKTLAYRLAEADMVFWVMPALMTLLIAGTLAQRWMGLWPAIDLFFGTFILWLGPLPLPGAYILLGILSINLTLKFTLKSDWKWRKSGIILSHLGALIILFGSLLTAITAKETFMVIAEGQSAQYTYSYSERYLLLYEGQNLVLKAAHNDVKNWDLSSLPFDINVTQSCKNCEIFKRQEEEITPKDANYQSMARFMAFRDKAKDDQPELNMPGIEFKLSGTEQDGTYVAFDGMPKPIEITMGERAFTIVFGKEQTLLPFSIELVDFVKDQYNGIDMARGYHSDVIIHDNGQAWPMRIEMNKPLRYRGLTFFQSSFEQTPDAELTVLSVVKNRGRLFPYIGTAIIGVGLLLHFCLIAWTKPSRKKSQNKGN